MGEFIAVLQAWARGEAGQIGTWSVPPPIGVNSVWWQPDATLAPDHYPLLEGLPEFLTRYREARLACNGQQVPPNERMLLQERLFDLDPDRALPNAFSRD